VTKEEILKTAENESLELIRFLYVDNDGLIRGYCVDRECLASDLDSGVAISEAMPSFSALDTTVPGSAFNSCGEFRAVPDLATFRVLPYAEKQGMVICNFRTIEDGETEVCARTALKRLLSSVNYEVKASFENEYYYLRKTPEGNYLPWDNSRCFATQGMQAVEQVVLETVHALRAQGMRVEKYYPEYGPGQQELAIRYAEGLAAADNQVFFRETVRAVAAKHNIIASFMPKPFQGLAGSGSHFHLSLWDRDHNLFYDENGKYSLSQLALNFIGGILEHIRPLCAFTASIVTSYKRLLPNKWASAYACYGPDNREAAVRIVSGQKTREAITTHLEYKPIDGACNPYLAMAALLAAGLDGIARKIDPKEAVLVNPNNLAPDEKEARGIRRLPRTLAEAVTALEGDEFFVKVFGKTMVQEYIALKKYQWEEYHNQVTSWEIDRYMEIY
jgi:glutamine synthetase